MEAVEEKIDDDGEETMSKIENLFQLEAVLINVLSKLPVKTLLRFSTREFIKLPDPPYGCDDDGVGFGYVESTDEYKVVRLTSYAEAKKCLVFTLGTTSSCSSSSSSSWAWREARMDPPIDVARGTSNPAFVNGAIHWIIYGSGCAPDKIIAFDVESEEFRLVRIPEVHPERKLSLVELKGLLSISYTIDSKMEIWMLRDYYCTSGNDHISGTWVKEYSIDLNIWPPSYQLEDQCYGYFTARDVEETKVLIENYGRCVGYYDLQTKRFEGLVHSGQMKFLSWSFYVESLRSLKRTISTS